MKINNSFFHGGCGKVVSLVLGSYSVSLTATFGGGRVHCVVL